MSEKKQGTRETTRQQFVYWTYNNPTDDRERIEKECSERQMLLDIHDMLKKLQTGTQSIFEQVFGK